MCNCHFVLLLGTFSCDYCVFTLGIGILFKYDSEMLNQPVMVLYFLQLIFLSSIHLSPLCSIQFITLLFHPK